MLVDNLNYFKDQSSVQLKYLWLRAGRRVWGAIFLSWEQTEWNGTKLNKSWNTSRAQGLGVVPVERSYFHGNKWNGTNDFKKGETRPLLL